MASLWLVCHKKGRPLPCLGDQHWTTAISNPTNDDDNAPYIILRNAIAEMRICIKLVCDQNRSMQQMKKIRKGVMRECLKTIGLDARPVSYFRANPLLPCYFHHEVTHTYTKRDTRSTR